MPRMCPASQGLAGSAARFFWDLSFFGVLMSVSHCEHFAALPEGYVAIPVSADQTKIPLRICVVVRREPDPAAGHLIVLLDTVDARVLLGCIADAGGRVQQWVELWIQNLESIAGTVGVWREALSNAALDDRWKHHFRALEKLEHSGIVITGWETSHPLPTFLDLAELAPVHPTDEASGAQWQLCQDDALLSQKNLPLYSTSLHRYLYLPALGAESPFVPVGGHSPTNEYTRPLSEITGADTDLPPLNPGGGLMLVRACSPIPFEAFVAVLSGESWEGVSHGRSRLDLEGAAKALKESGTAGLEEGRLFIEEQGRCGRLVETFHLKLRLLADAVVSVRQVVAEQQRPILNLSPTSFQVRLGKPGCGLPFLWTGRAVLTDFGDAVALPLEGTDVQYYLRAGAPAASVYSPAAVGLPVRGRGAVRIRKVVEATAGTIALEGTFSTQERVRAARNDLAWLRLNLGSGAVHLYAQLEEQTALAAGEWRFRTIGQTLSEAEVQHLRAAEGVPISDMVFEIVPLLSTPCDLYGLAVLCVRTLLVNNEATLPVALDETLSLAKQAAAEHDPSVSLGKRIRAIFERDERWLKSLGPHRLASEGISPEEGFDFVPAELWWDTLAMIIRMFPAIGPDSECRDYGDAAVGGFHKVFDRAANDLETLIRRTRSLIVIDWKYNREIHAVVRSHLTGLTGQSSPKG